MTYITKEEDVPQEGLAKVRARYIAGSGKSSIRMIVNEHFTAKSSLEMSRT